MCKIPSGSSDIFPGHRTKAESGEISVMTHQTSARKTPCTQRRIPHLNGGCEILEHAASHKLHHRHIPLTHKVLQVLLHDLLRGPTQLRHGSEGKERQHPVSSITHFYFLDLFLYLSFISAIGKEVGR
jgi:hypothetical protein